LWPAPNDPPGVTREEAADQGKGSGAEGGGDGAWGTGEGAGRIAKQTPALPLTRQGRKNRDA